MPLTYHHKTHQLQLGIWKSSESMEELEHLAGLRESEIRMVQSFKSELRKKEFLSVRALLHNLHPTSSLVIQYDENGKPYLDNMLSLSISHTQDYVSVLFSPLPYVGLDLETIRPQIEKIAHKFVNDEEANYIDGKNRRQHLHILWGAKEVLYKIYGKGNVDFRGHLYVAPFKCTDKGTTEATIRMPDFERTFQIHFERTENRMLAYATGE